MSRRANDTRIARRVKQIFSDEKAVIDLSHQSILRLVREWFAANPMVPGAARSREEIACVIVEQIRGKP